MLRSRARRCEFGATAFATLDSENKDELMRDARRLSRLGEAGAAVFPSQRNTFTASGERRSLRRRRTLFSNLRYGPLKSLLGIRMGAAAGHRRSAIHAGFVYDAPWHRACTFL